MSELRTMTQGRWQRILPLVGIPPIVLTPKPGPCPLCGEGKDRFRFDDRDGTGTWYCNKCGAGDGVQLAMRKNGWDFREAAKRIEGVLGATAPPPARKPTETTAEQQRAAKNKLWREAHPVRADDPVGRYLFRRVGLTVFPPCLRTADRLRYQDGLQGEPSWHPAMIAKVVDSEGRPVTLHRTYLTPGGHKAEVPKPKKLMAGRDDMAGKGPAIRLGGPVDGKLGIAEGIETALAASAVHGLPCWAAVSSTMLAQWEPPAGVSEVWIFADNDVHFAGLAAASALAHRIYGADRRVNLTMPERQGEDWADVWAREKGGRNVGEEREK